MSDTKSLRWDILESQPPSGERLTARLALPDFNREIYIAVDATNRRYVLVQLPPGEQHIQYERTSRGISVQTVEMSVGDGVGNNIFVEIACHEPSGYVALDIVTQELASALAAGASISRSRLVHNVLAKWQRFWSGQPRNLLSKEALLGLYGELWFLSRWLIPSIGAQQSVEMWRGPMGSRHDFETVGLAIEVKTTSRVDGSHQIHGIEQLQEPVNSALLLFSLLVREESGGENTLPQLVHELHKTLNGHPLALAQYEAALLSAGYEEAHESEYLKIRLRIRGQALYRVSGEFPRLIPSFLSKGVPAGINNVNYELRLDAAGPWMLSDSPSAVVRVLQDLSARGRSADSGLTTK